MNLRSNCCTRMWMPRAVSAAKSFLIFGTALVAVFAMDAHGQATSRGIKGTASRTELSATTNDQGVRTQTTFKAQVAAAEPGGVPSGTVTLMLGQESIGSAVLDRNGDAVTTADALP